MAVYILTTKSNVYAELKAAINADANLTLVYADGVDDLICTHAGLDIALKFEDVDDKGPKIYVGTGYTTGTDVDNSYKVAHAGNVSDMLNGCFIVGADYMVIMERGSNNYFYTLAIGKITRGDVVVIGGRGNDGYHWARSYNITLQEICEAIWMNASTITIGSNYAKMPLYVGQGNQVYMDGSTMQSMVKFSTLFRPANLAGIPLEVQGTDIILNVARKDGGVSVSGSCIIGEGLYV